MKQFFSLLSALAFAITCGAAPVQPAAKIAAKTKPQLQLPRAARAQMAAGGQSVYFKVLPLGPRSSRALLHLWSVARGNGRDGSDSALFCADIFRPNAEKTDWKLATSAVFLAPSDPHFTPEISTRWLRPQQKQGVVVEVNFPDALGQMRTFVTFPNGVEEGATYAQNFYSGNVGGAFASLEFGVDARGFLTVTKVISPHSNTPPLKTVFAWNGSRFAAAPTPETP